MFLSAEERNLLKSAQRDMAWLSDNYPVLVNKYNDRFVAIHDQKVVASSGSQEELIGKCVELGLNPHLTVVKFITNAAMILSSG